MILALGEVTLVAVFVDVLLSYVSPWLTATAICGQLLWLYLYLHNVCSTFERLNIPYSPSIPVIGNLWDYGEGIHTADVQCVKKYGKIFGTFLSTQPVVIVADPEFIKAAIIKDFNHFPNRSDVFLKQNDHSLFSKMLTMLKDDKWRRVRAIITPAFTTGKMKHMAPLVQRCVLNLSDLLNETAAGPKEFDVHKFFGGLTMDVISSCAFGTEVNSIRNPDNEVVKQSKTLFERDFLAPLMLVLVLFPNVLFRLLPALGLRIGIFKTEDFFKSLLSGVLEERRKRPNLRNDFLQLLLDTQNTASAKSEEDTSSPDVPGFSSTEKVEQNADWKATKEALTDDEIMAQSFLFLVAGYHTTATTLTFCLYSLATQPDVQQRCFEELKATAGKEVTYEMIQNQLPYLESVILETLRFYPPASRFDRVCSMDYERNGLRIPAGMMVGVAVHAIHHNSEYYPDPETFDPDRFSPEEKAKRDPCTFLPFGIGPRNCVGMRFALLEIKQTLANILLNFKFTPCAKTQKTLKLKGLGLIRPTEPIWLGIENR